MCHRDEHERRCEGQERRWPHEGLEWDPGKMLAPVHSLPAPLDSPSLSLLTLSLFGPESLYLLSSPQSGLGPLHNPDASVFTEAQPGLPDFQS